MSAAWPPGLLAAILLAGCAAVSGPPGSQGPPSLSPLAASGRQLAQNRCAGCHAMTPARPSLDHGAPPFWALGTRHNPDSLRRAIQTAPAHVPLAMPAVFLSPTESAAVVAYMQVLAAAPRSAWRSLDVAPCIATAHC